MESNYRLTLNIFKYAFLLIGMILIVIVLYNTITGFIQDKELIAHSKGKHTTTFVEGQYGDNACIFIDNKKFSCLGGPNTQISKYIEENNISYFDKIISDGQSSIIFTPNAN